MPSSSTAHGSPPAPEQEEVYDYYTLERDVDGALENTCGCKRGRDTPSVKERPWDTIDPSLIGKLRHAELRKFAKESDIPWATGVLSQLEPGYAPPARKPKPDKSSIPRVKVASWINNDRFNELARGDNAILRKPPHGTSVPPVASSVRRSRARRSYVSFATPARQTYLRSHALRN